MNENIIPKWQQELRVFLGIKSGIILEGNVYDEFPRFQYGDRGVSFLDTDNMDQTILSLVQEEQTEVFFFDPVDGFYCYKIQLMTKERCFFHCLMDTLQGKYLKIMAVLFV